MKVLGIIAEYNPFHNGHLYHLRESKKNTGADFVIAVMSGNFVQRGEPALINKWERAKVAVENGIDLVIELPVAFACNNSELFARGAVEILNGLGCVTHISFGSEEGTLDNLKMIARVLATENEVFKEVLKENLQTGSSFAKARERAVNSAAGMNFSGIIKGSNNILAIEYLKQLELTKSNMIPVTLKRKGPAYNDKEAFGDFASATLIRDILKTQGDACSYIPEVTLNSIKKQGALLYLEDFYQLIFGKLLQIPNNELKGMYSVSEGLENRIKNQLRRSDDIQKLIETVCSKRYTETRIKRVLIHSLLNLDKLKINEIINNKINYCRVLGFSGNGAKLLKRIKKDQLNDLQIITNINKEIDAQDKRWLLLNYDVLSSDLYNLVAKANIYENSDYVVKPYY
ncbi:MAG: nucleotidyltransferase [Peptostreptococcaceae bacterium]|nr:nucleotidyltransferase [Peptostreptococcaceae bacterium]